MAYWYEAGISVQKDCQKSLYHYSKIADHLYEMFLLNFEFVGGRSFEKQPMRLDKHYIYGNLDTSSSLLSKGISDEDIILLYKLQAENGDIISQFSLGQIYYAGSDKIAKNHIEAMKYFKMAAKKFSITDQGLQSKQVKISVGSSCSYIGRMYMRGEGIAVDFAMARKWFEKGHTLGSASSLTGLGRIYFYGLGIEIDIQKGMKFFQEAADTGDVSAKVFLALELQKEPLVDWGKVLTYLESAVKNGNYVAKYALGKIVGKGVPGHRQDCKRAVIYMKKWIEVTGWHDNHLNIAYKAYKNADYDSALLNYLIASELGYEVAQTNAAILLDKDLANFKNLNYNFSESNNIRYDVVLPLYLRAANQGNVEARVRAGDLYYYGFSKFQNSSISWTLSMLPNLIAEYFQNFYSVPNFQKAFEQYSIAADNEFSHSSAAMFNLGWMFENGFGTERDFFLAKRWYDLALVTNPSAYLAVNLAIFQLNLKWSLSDLFSKKSFDKNSSPNSVSELFPDEELIPEAGNMRNILLYSAIAVLTLLMYLRTRLFQVR